MKITPKLSAVLCSTLTVGTVALSAPLLPEAAAAQVQGQQTYTCAITVDENPTAPSYLDLTINMALNVPDQVTAGSDFTVDGSFSVQIPGELGTLFGAYFPSAQVTSDALTLPMTIGGQQQVVRTSYVDSGTIDTRRPPVVFGGSFSTDPVTVPQDAEGEIVITMPQNGTVPAISRDGMAAFTAVMVAQGGIVPGYEKGTDRISCDLAGGAPAQIGSIPIVAAQAPATASQPGATAIPAPAGGAPASAPSAGSPAATGNRVQEAQAGSPAAAPSVEHEGDHPAAAAAPVDGASTQAIQELTDQLRLQSLNQAAGQNDGAYVPLSVVGWGTAGIVLASAFLTVASNIRTRRLLEAAGER